MTTLENEVSRLDGIARRNHWIDADDLIVRLEKAGEGNMNRVSRAHIESGKTLILKESLPYVAKFPDIPAPIERIEVEALFYEAIVDTELTQRTPKILGYDPLAHCLCLEDLGRGSDLTNLYQEKLPVDAHTFQSLLSWLAGLHDVTIAAPTKFANKSMRLLNHEHIFSLPFIKDNGLEFSEELTQGWQKLLDDKLTQRATDLGLLYLEEASSGGVLLHGDFYPGSWLQLEANNIAIIDPEFGFYGPAEFDLGVFSAHLYLAGYTHTDVNQITCHYPKPFNETLAQQFTGVEILRRLFGVAQLPLSLTDSEKLTVAETARGLALA